MLSLLRKLAAPLVEASRLYRWPSAPRYNFEHEPRKSVAEIRRDMRAWKAKYGSHSFDYFKFGGALAGREVGSFMPYDLFRSYRNASNDTLVSRNDFNYVCLLEDKLVFSRYAAALGHPTPELLAVLDPHRFESVADRTVYAPDRFGDVLDGTIGVVKPIAGWQGAGVRMLEVRGGEIRLGGNAVSADELFAQLSTKHVYQKLVHQHPDLARLNPSSVNTLRLTTAQGDSGPVLLSAYLRVGAGGASVDNTSEGGLFVAVNEQGVLTGKAAYIRGKPMETAHPDSGVVFDGYALPYFQACVEAAFAFHDDLYGLHSVGWDVAITETGPTFIEGNARWGGFGPMFATPNFVRDYEASLGTLPPTPYRHRTVHVME